MSISTPLRRAVIAGLRDDTSLSGQFDIRYAWRRNWLDKCQLFTTNPQYDSPPAAIKSGRKIRDESGTFDIVVRVELPSLQEVPGEDQAETDQTCEDAMAVVQDFLADRSANELNITGLQWVREDSASLRGGHTDHSTVAEAILTVRYFGRRN